MLLTIACVSSLMPLPIRSTPCVRKLLCAFVGNREKEYLCGVCVSRGGCAELCGNGKLCGICAVDFALERPQTRRKLGSAVSGHSGA